jgi:hypothetical protein
LPAEVPEPAEASTGEAKPPPNRVGKTRVRPRSDIPSDIIADFETWYGHYPLKRQVKKAASLLAYDKQRRAGVDAATMLTGVFAFGFDAVTQFIPHPTTWLNDRRWEDAPGSIGTSGSPGAARVKPGSDNLDWLRDRLAVRDELALFDGDTIESTVEELRIVE